MEEEIENNAEEQEDNFFRDKIFDNEYEHTEADTTEKSLSIDSNFMEKSLDEKIDETMFRKHITELIDTHPRLNYFNTMMESGGFPKINKSEINEIYKIVTLSLPLVPKIEIFSIVTSIYDLSPDKFYESLSNTFKTDLIDELKSRGCITPNNTLF
jgi:hypothetical protein